MTPICIFTRFTDTTLKLNKLSFNYVHFGLINGDLKISDKQSKLVSLQWTLPLHLDLIASPNTLYLHIRPRSCA